MRKQDRDILGRLSRTFFLGSRAFEQQVCKHLRFFFLRIVAADHDAARMEVIVQSLGFAEEWLSPDTDFHEFIYNLSVPVEARAER